MKKNALLISIICVFVIGLYSTIPVFAIQPPTAWTSLPLTDSVNDVYQYPNTTAPLSGDKGDYRDEIDIKSVSIQGLNLTIEFCAPPTQSDSYNYTMYFNNNSDADAEYYLTTHTDHPNGYFSLIRASDGYYWNAAQLKFVSDNTVPLPTSIEGNYLILINISAPISSYLSMEISVIAAYIADSPTLYLDIAPNPAGGGIPSFTWILALVSILTLLGIIFYKWQEKINF